jgi:hypothetical protein
MITTARVNRRGNLIALPPFKPRENASIIDRAGPIPSIGPDCEFKGRKCHRMSDHSRALVPIDSSQFSSLDLFEQDRFVDVGLLAESLIYYDEVLVSVFNQGQFNDLIRWFLDRDLYHELIALIKERALGIYNYAFMTLPFLTDAGLVLQHVQDEQMARPNSFFERFIDKEDLAGLFPDRKRFNEFRNALEGRVVEAKSSEFGLGPLENALEDFKNPKRNALILQSIVDDIYRLKGLGRPPEVQAFVDAIGPGQYKATWNLDLDVLAAKSGEKLRIAPSIPVNAAATVNRITWAASRLGCDLYLPSPISMPVGDKLYEASLTPLNTAATIGTLQAQVEFPNIRTLVNRDEIAVKEVLKIRTKAARFRRWLQNGADLDRDAIIAYHHEVAAESGFISAARKALRIFGVVGGAAVGAALGAQAGTHIAMASVGGAGGAGLGYLLDLGSKIGADWRPVVFGRWYQQRIERLLKEADDKPFTTLRL